MSGRRLLLALVLFLPAVSSADPIAPVGAPRDTGLGWTLELVVAISLLIAVAGLWAAGRIRWRTVTIAIVAGGALLGGGALLDGAQTAVAVSL